MGTAGHSFSKTRVRDLFSVAPRRARLYARSLTHQARAPHGRDVLPGVARRPPEGAAETRRGGRRVGGTRRALRVLGRIERRRGIVFRPGGSSLGGDLHDRPGRDRAEARDESLGCVVARDEWRGEGRGGRAPRAPRAVRRSTRSPPQRPPSEIRPRRARAFAPDARLAPPRASRGVATVVEWRAKLHRRRATSRPRWRTRARLRVDDEAQDLAEPRGGGSRKMVRDLPRIAGAALSDARRVAPTVAGATRRTVDEARWEPRWTRRERGTAPSAARAAGSDGPRRGLGTSRRRGASRRKAERRAALANAARDAPRSAATARSRRAPSGANGRPRGSPRPPQRERSASGAARRRSRARGRASMSRFSECADAGKALCEETRRTGRRRRLPRGLSSGRRNGARVLRARERKEKNRRAEKKKRKEKKRKGVAAPRAAAETIGTRPKTPRRR